MKSMNFSKAVARGARGMLSGSDDVTIFSSSLPVLPHEKCMQLCTLLPNSHIHLYLNEVDLI